MGSNDDDKRLILTEVRGISSHLTSLTRTVDHIDQRLGDVEQRLGHVEQRLGHVDKRLSKVEKYTEIIPEMMAAIGNTSRDVDDHEKRITKLESATG